MLSEPVLSLRYLDEALTALSASKAGTDVQGDLASERMELAFLRLKMHIDPERMPAAEREADWLRKEFAEARGRFGAARFKLDDNDIDYLVAGGIGRRRTDRQGQPPARARATLGRRCGRRDPPVGQSVAQTRRAAEGHRDLAASTRPA